MHYEKSYYILQFGVPGGTLATLAGLALYRVFAAPGMVLSILGLLISFGSIIQAAVYFRCPYCDKRFPIRDAKLYPYCPECGRKLREGTE